MVRQVRSLEDCSDWFCCDVNNVLLPTVRSLVKGLPIIIENVIRMTSNSLLFPHVNAIDTEW